MTHDSPASPLIFGGAAPSSRGPLPTLPPLALYIHIPWCVRKCPYCDFNSHTASPVLPEEEYVDALLADLDQDLHAVYGRELSSIFFGGGTPSLFSGRAIARVLETFAARLSFAPDIEIIAYRGGYQAFQAAGMDAVDKIKRGSGGSGMVQGPDRIRSMKLPKNK